jgi:drug/metabolite transporter (DMT)-like permease
MAERPHLQRKYIASPLLLIVAAIWGSSFVVMKGTLARQDVNSFLATRFLIATLVLIAIKPASLKKIDRRFLAKGALVGTFLGTGYILQTFGLTLTTIAKTGFITGLYAVFTPLIAAGILRKRVTAFQWGAVLLATIGLALLSFKGFSMGLGEFLVLLSSLFFALHIIALGEWSAGMDTYALSIVQMATVTVIAYIGSLKSGYHLPPDTGVWAAVIYTGLFASAFAFFIMTWGQTFITPTAIGIILMSEYIFAALFAVIFTSERLTVKVLIGGSLVIVAMGAIIWADGREPEKVQS